MKSISNLHRKKVTNKNTVCVLLGRPSYVNCQLLRGANARDDAMQQGAAIEEDATIPDVDVELKL